MIKVASYNMRKAIGTDRRRMPERTLEVLREVDADIIALQECDRRLGERAGVIPLHMLDDHSPWKAVPIAIRAQSMGWHGNALLVRKEATISAPRRIEIPALEPRGAVRADVTLNGMTLRVVGMHLDLSGLWRRKQAHAILHDVDGCQPPLPSVLMGDLNEWTPQSGCLRDFGRNHCFAETGPSFHARHPVGRLDRIMVSGELRVVDSGTHHSAAARKASDHLPIWATLDAA
ncbi:MULTISPECIES: endonuclease/exonuclease/phosphatase family protein [unclassified Sphingomonas]|uniref:endonuclease/exonuclease/phosphatase family protein n=1 Tax=unclassified Sphingomonas TaxID=196159 RepID=UPI0006F4DF8A|nr:MULTISPECIES: endonuclease/exonuclease/phosphatase family protein [unclassified Sphingomonas]KQM66598.1 endonuclease [Sphingomonas sp. Leaf16]KQN16683.1 endonuclease [Sphingomonas sp. Leaf29]KQN23409.1 endonuclease [Sphingomonas sp. Leaf32]